MLLVLLLILLLFLLFGGFAVHPVLFAVALLVLVAAVVTYRGGRVP